ncbi:hypothetical protein NIES593_22455 [Hydrococcus rivularis NIES-593]|uniref:Uncharacterized protein n=1 Tax=Hydrococcus rivularis NIES-593 TaxID=1921803 RepID=A0A1U7H7B0_9CYAN|nr:hypothetical protein [Hydrococcus rivularis]OKH18145.1 hypothetical protein NIES593_22455 [Hydrococcus rivularis NIES-593]
MTVEKLEANGNQIQEAEQANDSAKTGNRAKKNREVVALSVKKQAEKESQLKHVEGLPENRPIGVSHLAIKEMDGQGLPNNRPVEASHLKVVSTYSSVGGVRPVVASGMEVSSTLAISGNRPIAASHLKISETYTVMGNRPVASNEIDDPAALMGFLD